MLTAPQAMGSPLTTAVRKRWSIVGWLASYPAFTPGYRPCSRSVVIHDPGPVPQPQTLMVPWGIVDMVPLPPSRLSVSALP
jgi:hypothetical protein